MPRYLAFLRGINLGRRRVKMDALRTLFEALKFANVSTFLASGNVIFDSRSAENAALETRIEAHLKHALGYEVATFLRTPAELAAVAAICPFAAGENETPGQALHVAFLRSALGDEARDKLVALRSAVDDFCVHGRELYWLCRGKVADSPFYGPLLAKTIGVASTMRNLKTVRQLAARSG
jgi:uncharacterized protein (DUF1697 family)